MRAPSYFWGDFVDRVLLIGLGLYYGAIPGFLALLLSDSSLLAIILTIPCGIAVGTFIKRSCDREHERRAERRKQ